MIRVALAQDHIILRSSIRHLIDAQTDMSVIDELSDCQEIVTRQPPLAADVLLMDLPAEGRNGMAAIQQLRERCPATRLLVFTACGNSAEAQATLNCGAAGYIGKHASEADLLSAIRTVHEGELFMDAEMAGEVVQNSLRGRNCIPHFRLGPMIKPLSRREFEVLQYLVQGYTNQQVADRLYLSVKTTETYRARLKQKLGLRTRADLVRFGFRMGLFGQDAAAQSQPA